MSGRRVLLDAYIAMIPKADGDATPPGAALLFVFFQWCITYLGLCWDGAVGGLVSVLGP